MKKNFTLFVILLLVLTPDLRAQFDAQKFEETYASTVRIRLLADQLIPLTAYKLYMPGDPKVLAAFEKTADEIGQELSYLSVRLDGNKKMDKLIRRLEEDWSLISVYLQKKKMHPQDWQKLHKLLENFLTGLQHLQDEILIFTLWDEAFVSALNGMINLNREVAEAFYKSLYMRLYPGEETFKDIPAHIERASKDLAHFEKKMPEEGPVKNLIRKLKSDLNMFYTAFGNEYDPKILFSVYDKFNQRVLKLNNEVFNAWLNPATE